MGERLKLREARGAKSLREVADTIGCSGDSLNNWEKGITVPQWHYKQQLRSYYGKDLADLGLADTSLSRGDEIEMTRKKLEGLNLSRRELIDMISGLSAFTGINLLILLDPHAVAPEDFLDQCNAGIAACWHLLKHDGLDHADKILQACMPKLAELANHESPYQQLAASLAAEAKMQQIILATHQLNYRAREIHSLAAVRFGRLSGDGDTLATSLSWLADFYISSWNRYPQPKKAIDIFGEGLAALKNGASLYRTELSLGLAKAYALSGSEAKALDTIQQARAAMPKHPELDPHRQICDLDISGLSQQEGRIYLVLHGHFPNQGYAELAYNTFNLRGRALSDRVQSQILIHKADAARAIGDFSHFIECLVPGLYIAFTINSLKRQKEALRILDNVPDTWKKEDQYQEVVKMF